MQTRNKQKSIYLIYFNFDLFEFKWINDKCFSLFYRSEKKTERIKRKTLLKRKIDRKKQRNKSKF